MGGARGDCRVWLHCLWRRPWHWHNCQVWANSFDMSCPSAPRQRLTRAPICPRRQLPGNPGVGVPQPDHDLPPVTWCQRGQPGPQAPWALSARWPVVFGPSSFYVRLSIGATGRTTPASDYPRTAAATKARDPSPQCAARRGPTTRPPLHLYIGLPQI